MKIIVKIFPESCIPKILEVTAGKHEKCAPSQRNERATHTGYRYYLSFTYQIVAAIDSWIVIIKRYTFLKPNMSWREAQKYREQPLQTLPIIPAKVSV